MRSKKVENLRNVCLPSEICVCLTTSFVRTSSTRLATQSAIAGALFAVLVRRPWDRLGHVKLDFVSRALSVSFNHHPAPLSSPPRPSSLPPSFSQHVSPAVTNADAIAASQVALAVASPSPRPALQLAEVVATRDVGVRYVKAPSTSFS